MSESMTTSISQSEESKLRDIAKWEKARNKNGSCYVTRTSELRNGGKNIAGLCINLWGTGMIGVFQVHKVAGRIRGITKESELGFTVIQKLYPSKQRRQARVLSIIETRIGALRPANNRGSFLQLASVLWNAQVSRVPEPVLEIANTRVFTGKRQYIKTALDARIKLLSLLRTLSETEMQTAIKNRKLIASIFLEPELSAHLGDRVKRQVLRAAAAGRIADVTKLLFPGFPKRLRGAINRQIAEGLKLGINSLTTALDLAIATMTGTTQAASLRRYFMYLVANMQLSIAVKAKSSATSLRQLITIAINEDLRSTAERMKEAIAKEQNEIVEPLVAADVLRPAVMILGPGEVINPAPNASVLHDTLKILQRQARDSVTREVSEQNPNLDVRSLEFHKLITNERGERLKNEWIGARLANIHSLRNVQTLHNELIATQNAERALRIRAMAHVDFQVLPEPDASHTPPDSSLPWQNPLAWLTPDYLANFGIAMLRHLDNAAALIEEGKEMQHCVGVYNEYCAKLESFIYAVKFDTGERATLEMRRNHLGGKPAWRHSSVRGCLGEKTNEWVEENTTNIICVVLLDVAQAYGARNASLTAKHYGSLAAFAASLGYIYIAKPGYLQECLTTVVAVDKE